MKHSKCKLLVDKSVGAALSAIEIYNKPDFKYREETFSILMINAWELLLKAKILKEFKNDMRSIFEMRNKLGKDGKVLKAVAPVLNRSNNPKTIGLPKCLALCEQPPISLNQAIRDNLYVLIEIRDTAIHFQHNDKFLCKKVFEIGTASLKNYLTLIKYWFDYDLSIYNFFLMPITFFHAFEAIKSYSINSNKKQVENLLKYISIAETETPSNVSNVFNISLQLETKFIKSSSTESLLVQYTKDESALKVHVQEEDALKNFPFDYDKLTNLLRKKYPSFKVNNAYHKLRKDISKNKKYCKTRQLDPANPRSLKKDFYSSEILKEFEKHYGTSGKTTIK